ncbi:MULTISPECIES: cytochrome b [unclassified Duganella]|uniref:cytochrome b n=1 Tax=unclassified Duganella TaxID=2636909 RepID=UPI000E3574E0|nr:MULTISPECIES: cytochrome b [unclassified Duganella]RFP12004.1 cytochrome b [Duganella sp. BJB475]RFP29985.1 cytochrome b [Duganella sp. BJB476]
MDNKTNFSRTTIVLHWLVAASIIGLIALGIYMVETESWHLYDIHKSIGLLTFVAILARLAWRWRNGLPQPVRPVSRLEYVTAVAAHVVLLILTVVLPLSGMLYSGASGHGFGIFDWEIFPSHYLGDQAVPLSARWSDIGQTLHGLLGYLLLTLIVLHAAAALKHHFIDKDATLKRMLGRTSKST